MNKIIQYKSLKEIDYNDKFFDSLREDYYNFNNWFITKQNEERKAYVTYYSNNKISSFLLLKLEDDNEFDMILGLFIKKNATLFS